MRAKALRSFRDLKTGRYYAKRDVFSVSKERFEELQAKRFATEASVNEKLSPKRDKELNCIICKKK